MARKRCMALGAIIFSLGCLLSCGLEAYLYLDYVPDVNQDNPISISARLPGISAEGYSNYFTHFVIFYRIYMSGINPSGLVNTPGQRAEINPTLSADFNYIYSSTDKTSTTVNTSNLATYFFNRNYFQLTLVNANIDNVLSSGSLGRTLDIFFSTNTGEQPTMSIDGGLTYHFLQRAVEGPTIRFDPEPDRYFLNSPELCDSDYATREINADVANRSETNPVSRYTYVSMYIAAVGQDYTTTIYSQPTHLGIFQLADY